MARLLSAVWLALASSVMIGQSPRPATTKPAGSHNQCAQLVDKATHSGFEQKLFVAFPQNQDPARDKWRPVHSLAEQQEQMKNGNSGALVFLQAGRVIMAQFTFQSQFGDWVSYVNYCYRPDGALSHLHALLNSFHGETTVIRDASFDSAGRQTAHSQANYQLGTRTPKKLDPTFWDQPPPLFLHVNDLPFERQVAEPAASKP